MRIYDIIDKKKRGEALTKQEITYFIESYTADQTADYQAAALLMAMFINGMSSAETIALTEAMMYSGDTVDLSEIAGQKVDKHSTGGVGDTTTLVLAPLVAAAGVPVAKMSGRGLGHTGGTIDKLESIVGFQVELTRRDFIKQVNAIGIAVMGQSKNIAPADKKLYSLRDVTATVDHHALIASSIMSKKLAAGADAIVLDVKTGSGAFIKSEDAAAQLAKVMVEIGTGMQRATVALITDMSQPLGYAIGNSIEIIEAVETLKGGGPADLRELCLALGANMLMIGGAAENYEEAHQQLVKQLDSGQALETFRSFIRAQGGDDNIIDDYQLLPQAKYQHRVYAPQTGYLAAFDCQAVGETAALLGAGRTDLDSQINLAAGIQLAKKQGDRVRKGEIVATFYSDVDVFEQAERKFLKALTIHENAVSATKLIRGRVDHSGIVLYK